MAMTTYAVVVDLDNTIVDTAVRKCAILNAWRDASAPQVTVEGVRADFEMRQWITSQQDLANVFRQLNSAEGVRKYVASFFDGASAAIHDIEQAQIDVVILTTRAEALRDATIDELKRGGVDVEPHQLLMRSGIPGNPEPSIEDAIEFKRARLERLVQEYCILGYVGDRPLDAIAAKRAGVIPILFTSTIAPEELKQLKEALPEIQECHSWVDVRNAVLIAKASVPELEKLRQSFITQYGGWLRDIDEKCRITVMIATVLVGVSAKQLLEETDGFLKLTLVAALLASLLALVYGIKAYTSRHTSGQRAGGSVKPSFKQWIGYLLGWPEKWMYVKGDEVAQWKELCKSSASVQKNAHVPFFVGRYRTLSSEAMLNIRLFELRSSNYSKLYGERLASRLLIFAVVANLVRIVGAATGNTPAVDTDTGLRRELGQVTEAVQALQKRVQAIDERVTALISAEDTQAATLAALKSDVAKLGAKGAASARNFKGKAAGTRTPQ